MNQFLMGFGAGITLGVLFAPRSGKAIRHYITQQTNEMRESTLDAVDRGRELINRQVERLATPRAPGAEIYQR
jgi:gas vesicle protein